MMSLILKKPFDDLVPTQLPSGEWFLSYEIVNDRGAHVSRSYFQAPTIVELLRQLAQVHSDATLALSRCRKREAKLKASK
jgi:hypothetical protein